MAARRNVCAAAVDKNGLVLKILPDRRAIGSWMKKHGVADCVVRTYTSRAAVNREFDRQMQIGLTDGDVIAALLWYGGISRTKDFDQNGHLIPKRSDETATLLWYGGFSRTKDFDENGRMIPKDRAKHGAKPKPACK